ncbi:hypothetical protein HDE_00888 [Halotydeus destructor]|nr:hypothetical protein HDE_00888 [Halotydeus destructor]
MLRGSDVIKQRTMNPLQSVFERKLNEICSCGTSSELKLRDLRLHVIHEIIRDLNFDMKDLFSPRYLYHLLPGLTTLIAEVQSILFTFAESPTIFGIDLLGYNASCDELLVYLSEKRITKKQLAILLETLNQHFELPDSNVMSPAVDAILGNDGLPRSLECSIASFATYRTDLKSIYHLHMWLISAYVDGSIPYTANTHGNLLLWLFSRSWMNSEFFKMQVKHEFLEILPSHAYLEHLEPPLVAFSRRYMSHVNRKLAILVKSRRGSFSV